MSFSEMNDTQSLLDEVQTRVRLHYQIENRGCRIARSVGLLQRTEDERSVLGFGGDVLSEGLRGFVELELGEDVESDAFATEGEEVMWVGPV